VRKCASFLLERFFDGGDDFVAFGGGAGAELGDDVALAIDEILLKVPHHVAGDLFVGVGGEKLVEGADIVALDGDLGEEVEVFWFRQNDLISSLLPGS